MTRPAARKRPASELTQNIKAAEGEAEDEADAEEEEEEGEEEEEDEEEEDEEEKEEPRRGLWDDLGFSCDALGVSLVGVRAK